jgi:hypothetical protein
MATLRPRLNPGSRLEAGNYVIERASSVSIKPIKPRFDAFKKTFAQFQSAEASVSKAVEAADAASTKVAELDSVQDEAVLALAAAMAGDGAPRANPFKPLGFAAPAKVADMRYELEVATVTKLAAAAARAKSASKATKAAAAKLIKAAAAVKAALPAMDKTAAARATAIAKREAIGLDFDRALAKLKRAARVAEDDGAEGLFAALFQVDKARPKKKAKSGSTSSASSATGSASAPTNGAGTAAASGTTTGSATPG